MVMRIIDTTRNDNSSLNSYVDTTSIVGFSRIFDANLNGQPLWGGIQKPCF